MKKFELIKTSKKAFNGEALFQLKAKVSFGSVKKGELGGYVAKEENLSHDGNAWVYGNARVSGNARVYGDAEVYGNARVYGDAEVYGNARVSGNARVYGDAWVYGNAWVYGDAEVYGYALVSGNARVYGDAEVYGNARVSGNARVYGDAEVSGDAEVYGNALDSGYCFAYKGNDWDVTEVPTKDGEGVLLVKDYVPPKSEDSPPEEITIKGAKYRLVSKGLEEV